MIGKFAQWFENIKYQRKLKLFRESLRACGEGLELFGKPVIYSAGNLAVGDNCKINEGVYINARSGVTIGNNVTLSPFCKVISTGYDVQKWVNTGVREHDTESPIIIGDNCWICAGAMVLSGVRITGQFVILAAGAVLTHDVNESYVVLAGSPAKVVKHLNREASENDGQM